MSSNHNSGSDSETESDDNISLLAASRFGVKAKKKDEKLSKSDGGNVRSKRIEKKKKLLSAEEANEVGQQHKVIVNVDKDDLVELATKYQKCMKKWPIPIGRFSHAMAVNWKGMAEILERLYGQQLHYLTHMMCKEWDKSRFGSEDEGKPLNDIIDWSDAEDTIWHVEEVHRLLTSPTHLAMLWSNDPEHRAYVDEVVPSS
ncbi:hypothetical protein TanjilG_10211 [Lupinus angustifolius]|uniref:Protein RDM1 n=1 Tax=Lupinus angustifolius TaxID=3871 RepID=A0A4P1RC11_LUPAN|nr:PREDICTED: protein RDM1-like [Lupinus angustifolius]OIW07376.1 hypothetical protein TanjilG_10211 [Lupinus angustifolius]